jgi:hypothetical protein
MVGTTTSVLVGNDVWDIFSESENYVFDKHYYDIIKTAKSFSLSDFSSTSTNISPPQSGKIYKIYFDSLPEWAINDVNQSLTEASNYWYDKDGVKFQRVYNENDSDFQVYWTKNYGHPQLGYNYYSLIEIGLGDDVCAAQWQPYSQDTVNETITHEIGHALGHDHSNDPNDVI